MRVRVMLGRMKSLKRKTSWRKMTFQKRLNKEARKLVRRVSGDDRSEQTSGRCSSPEAVPECPRNSKKAGRVAGADSKSKGPEAGAALGYSGASKRVMGKERMVSARWSGTRSQRVWQNLNLWLFFWLPW